MPETTSREVVGCWLLNGFLAHGFCQPSPNGPFSCAVKMNKGCPRRYAVALLWIRRRLAALCSSSS